MHHKFQVLALRAAALAVVASLSTSAASAALTFVSDRSDLAPNDSINWGTVGPTFANLGSSEPFTSWRGLDGLAFQYGSGSLRLFANGFGYADYSTGWSGSFGYGEPILYGQNGFGIIPLQFFTPVSAAGAQVEINGNYGANYTIQIEAYNPSGSFLGSARRTGTVGWGDSQAIFMGLTSTSADIGYLLFRTIAAQTQRSEGLAINTVSIRNPDLGGFSQTAPLFPTSIGPNGEFVFDNVESGLWMDPVLADGFAFTTTDGSHFTQILDFPTGFTSPFEVLTGGISLGLFGPGQSVTFPFPVSEFTIRGIQPLVDAEDPLAFPIRLAFDQQTASFQMTALAATTPVPEPSSMALLAVGTAGLWVGRRRLHR